MSDDWQVEELTAMLFGQDGVDAGSVGSGQLIIYCQIIRWGLKWETVRIPETQTPKIKSFYPSHRLSPGRGLECALPSLQAESYEQIIRVKSEKESQAIVCLFVCLLTSLQELLGCRCLAPAPARRFSPRSGRPTAPPAELLAQRPPRTFLLTRREEDRFHHNNTDCLFSAPWRGEGPNISPCLWMIFLICSSRYSRRLMRASDQRSLRQFRSSSCNQMGSWGQVNHIRLELR